MDARRYAQVKAMFREAIRWRRADRAEVVRELARGDASLCDEVLSLLAHHEEPAERARGSDEGDRARGPTLADVFVARAPASWPIERVVEVLAPVAGALGQLADRGAVHGAVRADRIAWTEGAVAALERGGEGSGGAAGAGDPSDVIDDPDTAAPEQLSLALGPVGPWTDVYGLALVCVELLCGRPVRSAGEGRVAAAVARAREDAIPPTPRALGLEVPAPIEAALAMALAVRPIDRYQEVRRFWRALTAAVAESEPPPRSSTALAPVPPVRRARCWLSLRRCK